MFDSGGHATHIWFSEDSSQLRASDDRGEAAWQLPAAGDYAAPVLMALGDAKDGLSPLEKPLVDKLAVPEGERQVLAEAVDRSGRRAVIIGGQYLRGGQERTLEVWEGGEKLAEQPYDPVFDDDHAAFLQFAGQGRFLVIGTGTGLEMVDAITLAPVATLYHSGAILAGAQMDGLRAVTMDHSQSIRIWETATGREVARLAASRPARALALSSDGRWLAALAPGRQIDLWALAPDDVIAQACRWLDDPCP